MLDEHGGFVVDKKSPAWTMIKKAIQDAKEAYPKDFIDVKVINQCYYIKMTFRSPKAETYPSSPFYANEEQTTASSSSSARKTDEKMPGAVGTCFPHGQAKL